MRTGQVFIGEFRMDVMGMILLLAVYLEDFELKFRQTVVAGQLFRKI